MMEEVDMDLALKMSHFLFDLVSAKMTTITIIDTTDNLNGLSIILVARHSDESTMLFISGLSQTSHIERGGRDVETCNSKTL
jgi:hypothetical protein